MNTRAVAAAKTDFLIPHLSESSGSTHGSAAFSPDGKRIAFVSSADGNAEIYLMNSDGAGLLRLTRNKAEDTTPQFSKDGKNLIFTSNRNGRFALYQIQL